MYQGKEVSGKCVVSCAVLTDMCIYTYILYSLTVFRTHSKVEHFTELLNHTYRARVTQDRRVDIHKIIVVAIESRSSSS